MRMREFFQIWYQIKGYCDAQLPSGVSTLYSSLKNPLCAKMSLKNLCRGQPKPQLFSHLASSLKGRTNFLSFFEKHIFMLMAA